MLVVKFTIKPTYAHTVRSKPTKFGRLTHGEECRIMHDSYPKGASTRTPNFWTS